MVPDEGEVGVAADPDSVTVVQITVVDEMYEVAMVFGAAVGTGAAATLLVIGSLGSGTLMLPGDEGSGAGAG